MDLISYALSKKIAAHAISGVQSMSVSGQTLTINTKDSGVLTMTFPTPKDGVSVTDIDVNANNQIVFTMSDGSEFISGKIPTVKGDPFKYSDFTPEQLDSLKGSDGFSPSAKIEKVGDTATITITDKDGTTTATIKDGQGGGTADVPIEKIKVNGELQTPVNKVVDITVPDAYDDTDIRAKLSNINTSLDGKLNKTFTGDDVANKILSTDKDGNVVLKNGGSGEGTAETTTYTNADYPSYTNVDLALDALFSKVYYVKPTCSLSASKAGGTFEMGTTITAPITFTWTTNKAITSQTLTGCTLADASVRTATYNTNVTSDKTFTLSVSDGENSASSSVSYKFLNNIFWGSAAAAETYDSAFIRALSNKKLASAVKGTYSFNIASGEYGFWAVPSNMTISSVWIGGFEVTVDDLGTVSYTNAQGYTRDYKLYKTGKSGLGAISAEIK